MIVFDVPQAPVTHAFRGQTKTEDGVMLPGEGLGGGTHQKQSGTEMQTLAEPSAGTTTSTGNQASGSTGQQEQAKKIGSDIEDGTGVTASRGRASDVASKLGKDTTQQGSTLSRRGPGKLKLPAKADAMQQGTGCGLGLVLDAPTGDCISRDELVLRTECRLNGGTFVPGQGCSMPDVDADETDTDETDSTDTDETNDTNTDETDPANTDESDESSDTGSGDRAADKEEAPAGMNTGTKVALGVIGLVGVVGIVMVTSSTTATAAVAEATP